MMKNELFWKYRFCCNNGLNKVVNAHRFWKKVAHLLPTLEWMNGHLLNCPQNAIPVWSINKLYQNSMNTKPHRMENFTVPLLGKSFYDCIFIWVAQELLLHS